MLGSVGENNYICENIGAWSLEGDKRIDNRDKIKQRNKTTRHEEIVDNADGSDVRGDGSGTEDKCGAHQWGRHGK